MVWGQPSIKNRALEPYTIHALPLLGLGLQGPVPPLHAGISALGPQATLAQPHMLG